MADVTASIIPALRRDGDIPYVEKSRSSRVFLMFGDITNVRQIVQKLHQMNKKVFLHFDLLKGFSQDREALAFIAEEVKPYGIVTTKGHIIKMAKTLGLVTIHHLFLIDTNAFNTGIRNVKESKPHGVEIMPGLMPSVIKDFMKEIPLPVYAGGLVRTLDQAQDLVSIGVSGVISGYTVLWQL